MDHITFASHFVPVQRTGGWLRALMEVVPNGYQTIDISTLPYVTNFVWLSGTPKKTWHPDYKQLSQVISKISSQKHLHHKRWQLLHHVNLQDILHDTCKGKQKSVLTQKISYKVKWLGTHILKLNVFFSFVCKISTVVKEHHFKIKIIILSYRYWSCRAFDGMKSVEIGPGFMQYRTGIFMIKRCNPTLITVLIINLILTLPQTTATYVNTYRVNFHLSTYWTYI